MKQFETGWPKTFYEPLSNKVVTMSVTKKRIKLGSADCVDTNLIYSRVMGLMSSRDVDLTDVFSYEPKCQLRCLKIEDNEVKTTLKRKLQVEESPRTLSTPETIVVDGCAILWVMQWPKHGTVQQDYVNNALEYIFGNLQHSDVNIICDRYYEYSINSSTKTSRTVQASRRHRQTPSTPLPAQNVVLTVKENKQQIIDTICEQITVGERENPRSNNEA